MIRNIEKHIKLKHWFAFSVQILLMALTSCGLDSRKIEKVTQIEYRAKISDVPNGRVISVGAKSKSGVVVIGQVNPGMILYFKDTDDSHHRFMGLEMLLDPDVQYEIVDNEWTTIIQINLEKRVKGEVDSIGFRLKLDVDSEDVQVKIKKNDGSIWQPARKRQAGAWRQAR